MPSTQMIDCRGQQCPAPILATARAAKSLGRDGGTLEILADDDAFPLDLESWCRSSGASLLDLQNRDGAHRALVRVGAPTVKAAPPPPPPRPAAGTQVVDCRGMECPAPILEVARAARANPGIELEVLADDDAFELDIASWCRSAKADLASITRTDGVYRAVVRTAGAAPQVAPPRAPQAAAPAAAPATSQVREVTQQIDCRGMECPQPLLEVARAARQHPGATLEVLADDDAFELDIASWCRSAKADLVSIERVSGVFHARVQLAGGQPPVASAPPASLTPATPPPSLAAPDLVPGDGTTFRLDLGALDPSRYDDELERSYRQTRASRLAVIAPDRRANATLLKWCTDGGHVLESLSGAGPVTAEIALARSPEPAAASTALALAPQSAALAAPRQKRAVLLVLHNDKEALLAALLVANGAAAQGMDVTLFFTFWGLNLLRGDDPNGIYPKEKVSWAQRLFKWLMPAGPKRQGLGKLNFGGMGASMMNTLMRKKNIMDLPALLESAQDQGVRFVACTMSMNVMGITKRDLHPYSTLVYGGVATFVEDAGNAELSLVF